MKWYDYEYLSMKPIHWLLVFVVAFGVVALAFAFKYGYESANREKEFYFENDKEVTRFYYEGYITLKGNDNSMEIILEDYDKEDYE